MHLPAAENDSEPPTIEFSLRAAAEGDFAWLWGLVAVTMRPHVEVSSLWDCDVQEALFRERFTASRWRIVVDPDGADIGAYAVKQGRVITVLTDIYLLPEYQRRGIGSAIVAGLVAQASVADRPLALFVLKDNIGAMRLYVRHGLRTIGERNDQWVMKFGGDDG